MGYNNNVFNYGECIKIGSFPYALEGDKNLHSYDQYTKEHLSIYALLDKDLEQYETFYIKLDDYLKNIVYNRLQGHEMFLKKGNNDKIIEVYSLNYNKIKEYEKCIYEVKKR